MIIVFDNKTKDMFSIITPNHTRPSLFQEVAEQIMALFSVRRIQHHW